MAKIEANELLGTAISFEGNLTRLLQQFQIQQFCPHKLAADRFYPAPALR
ncbi:MAG: hypothetical protein RLZZ511_1997 [Cyanobacteriota bacterium]|jgi:hypothetical protein